MGVARTQFWVVPTAWVGRIVSLGRTTLPIDFERRWLTIKFWRQRSRLVPLLQGLDFVELQVLGVCLRAELCPNLLQ